MKLFLLFLYIAHLNAPPLTDTIPVTTQLAVSNVADTIDFKKQGEADAVKYYKGSKWLNKATTLFTIVNLSGIHIAIFTQFNHKIKEKNLHYPDKELWKNEVYKKAYIDKAIKIRRAQVWRHFAIALVVLLIGALIILALYGIYQHKFR